MIAAVVITALIIIVFAIDIGGRWWRENEWRRRWKKNPDDEDD